MKARLPIDQETFWYVGPRYTTSSDGQLQLLKDLQGKFCCWVPIGVEEGAGAPVNHMNTREAWQGLADTLHRHTAAFGPVTVELPRQPRLKTSKRQPFDAVQ